MNRYYFYPQLNWKEYFNNILSMTSYQVDDSEPIIVKEPEFLKQLSHTVLLMMTTTEGRRLVKSCWKKNQVKVYKTITELDKVNETITCNKKNK